MPLIVFAPNANQRGKLLRGVSQHNVIILRNPADGEFTFGLMTASCFRELSHDADLVVSCIVALQCDLALDRLSIIEGCWS